MSDRPKRSGPAAFSELLAADKATRAAAAAVEQWLDLYRKAADETLSEPQLDVLLRQALEAITRMLDADAASLLIANDDGTELISRAGFGLGREVELSLSIPSGSGAAGTILATGEPRIIADLTQVQVMGGVLRASGHRSFVGVPISSSGRTFGVLHATARRESAFQSDDVDMLMWFAEPIAAAFGRVELFEAERAARQIAERATERVRGLQRTTAALVAAVTVEEICRIILQEAVPGSVEGGEGAIWMLRDSRLLLVAGFGASAEFPEIPLNSSLPAAGILREGIPLFVETRAEMTRRWPVLASGQTVSFAGLPLIAEDRRLGLMAVGFREEHRFASDEREYLAAIAEQAAAALAQAQARDELEEARRTAELRGERLDFLADASARLSESLDLEVTCEVVADLSVPRLTDRCALYLLEEETISKRILAPDLNEDESRLFFEAEETLQSPAGVGAVIRTGRPLHIEHLEDAALDAIAESPEHLELLRRVGFGGLLILPLRARGHTLGALAFVNRKGRPMDDEARLLAEELASRAAMAVDNAMLFEGESHVAHRLAESLLPARLPMIGGLELAVRYRAASAGLNVGGDFYDAFQLAEDGCIILIGDVQGKGVEAAAIIGLARHTVRAAAQFHSSPARLLQHLNTAIIQNVLENAAERDRPWADAKLCTAAIVRLDRGASGWSATVSCAGHPPPLLRHTSGRVEGICEPAILLGVAEGPPYSEMSVALEPGSVLVLYTDGVSDRHADGEMFGSEGITAVLSATRGSASEVADDILGAALQHTTRREDDLVVLTVRVR